MSRLWLVKGMNRAALKIALKGKEDKGSWQISRDSFLHA